MLFLKGFSICYVPPHTTRLTPSQTKSYERRLGSLTRHALYLNLQITTRPRTIDRVTLEENLNESPEEVSQTAALAMRPNHSFLFVRRHCNALRERALDP
jgi:hypothetical protein